MSETTKSSKTIEVLKSEKNKNLLSLVPEGMSAKLYIDLIKEQVMAPDNQGRQRSDDDLLLFLYVCKRTGLDPLTKQIYAVFRWDTNLGKEKMSIQTGIDGMRLVAERTAKYAGQDDIKYFPEDESTRYPTKASCTVYKMIGEQRVAFTATVRWDEYVQKNKSGEPVLMWSKMPYNQLGKCAEAAALRKGFPNELSGIYSSEEMGQADNTVSELPPPPKAEKPDVTLGGPADDLADKTPSKIGEKTPDAVNVAEMREKIKNEEEK